jgi:hypothetical protein
MRTLTARTVTVLSTVAQCNLSKPVILSTPLQEEQTSQLRDLLDREITWISTEVNIYERVKELPVLGPAKMTGAVEVLSSRQARISS